LCLLGRREEIAGDGAEIIETFDVFDEREVVVSDEV
jgi:hypothetical protein